VEPGSREQECSQTERVRQSLSQGKRLEALLQGLIRIAKKPEGPGCEVLAAHPRIMAAIEKRQRAMLLEIIEGYPPLTVLSGQSQLPQEEQSGPQRMVALHQKRRVLDTLGYAEKLLP
jgi:hypothetical protein